MDIREIKMRRLANQYLIEPTDARTVLRDLCGLQAQFLSNAFHALRIRSTNFNQTPSEGYMKNWTLRGTMHLFDEYDLPLMLHKGRTHKLRPCDTLDTDEWISAERKRYFADLILSAVSEGNNEREGLKQICAKAGMTANEEKSIFNPWGGLIRALCGSGRLSHAVSERKALVPCPAFTPMEKDEAERELVRRYFAHYGPATIRDAAYFFGCKQSDVKRWLDKLSVKAVTCGERTYYYIEETPENREIPACIFLAGFDPLMMGYEKTENPFLLPEYLRAVFSLSGIVMPTLLIDGSVGGKWKRTGKQIDVTLFDQASRKTKAMIEDVAGQLWHDVKEVRFL